MWKSRGEGERRDEDTGGRAQGSFTPPTPHLRTVDGVGRRDRRQSSGELCLWRGVRDPCFWLYCDFSNMISSRNYDLVDYLAHPPCSGGSDSPVNICILPGSRNPIPLLSGTVAMSMVVCDGVRPGPFGSTVVLWALGFQPNDSSGRRRGSPAASVAHAHSGTLHQTRLPLCPFSLWGVCGPRSSFSGGSTTVSLMGSSLSQGQAQPTESSPQRCGPGTGYVTNTI